MFSRVRTCVLVAFAGCALATSPTPSWAGRPGMPTDTFAKVMQYRSETPNSLVPDFTRRIEAEFMPPLARPGRSFLTGESMTDREMGDYYSDFRIRPSNTPSLSMRDVQCFLRSSCKLEPPPTYGVHTLERLPLKIRYMLPDNISDMYWWACDQPTVLQYQMPEPWYELQ